MSTIFKRKQLKFNDEQEVEVTKVKQTHEQTTQTIATSTSDLTTTDERHQVVDFKVDDFKVGALNGDEFKVGDFKASDFLSQDFIGTSVRSSNSDCNDSLVGRYVNWSSQHSMLSSLAWCCVGDLISFCNKYEFKVLSLTDVRQHQTICGEIRSLLSGAAPFHMRRRFPGNIHNPENLWVCIGRCAGVEYHLNRILNIFRKPLDRQLTERQREARQNFHLAINELRLDISARISAVKLYDRDVFEREFQLNWVAQ